MFSRSLWEWWDQLPWGFWGLWRHLQQRRGAGDGAGGGSSKKRAWKQRGEAETSDRALDWGWEVIHNPLEDSKEPLFQSWQSLCLGFLWESFPNYPRSWGRGLIPENSSGAKEKKIPQLAAHGPWTLHKNLSSCREFGKIFFSPQNIWFLHIETSPWKWKPGQIILKECCQPVSTGPALAGDSLTGTGGVF